MHLGYLSALSKTIQVTPNNSADLPGGFQSRAISVTVTGNVSYVNDKGETSTVRLVEGVFYPIAAVRIRATGTTATGIEAHA
jgi:hypothetical protein